MEIYEMLPELSELEISKTTEEMVLFKPFLLINPETASTFPDFDEPYYTSLEYILRHLLYKFEHNWIKSERQVMYTSDECISTIHFIYDENKKVCTINVFQRSSNLNNLKEDVQFFNYFIKKYFDRYVELNIIFSMPHIMIEK